MTRLIPRPGEPGYLPGYLTAEHVGWIKALMSEFERLYDVSADEDPGSTLEMLCWCRDAIDQLSRLYPPCSECGDQWAVDDGLCEHCAANVRYTIA